MKEEEGEMNTNENLGSLINVIIMANILSAKIIGISRLSWTQTIVAFIMNGLIVTLLILINIILGGEKSE